MKWEYKTEIINHQTVHKHGDSSDRGETAEQRINKILAELGNEGWELASTTKYFDPGNMLLIFKRPV